MSKEKLSKKQIGVGIVVIVFFILAITLSIRQAGNKPEGQYQISLEEMREALNSGNFASDDLRKIDGDDIILGSKNAKLQVIVYEDLSSYYSALLDESLSAIRQDFGNEIAIAFRPYADKAFLGAISVNLWSQCANDQGKFFEARDKVFQELREDSFSEEFLPIYSEEIGLDLDILNKCLEDEKYLTRLEYLKGEAENFDVYGAPTTFVDEEMVTGARSVDDVVSSSGEQLEGLRSIVSRHLN